MYFIYKYEKAFNIEMKSSGDLQIWQLMYNKEITIVPSNNVQFYRLEIWPENKGQ